MNKEDEDRQIRETRSLLQKAGQRNASLDTRRDALRRLINLTHTPSRELKVFAAQNFSKYFKDFPDLEQDVIDSVYDICEDPDSQVRMEGYRTIVSLSAESRKWTRRNTDVLVQLLQSDEPVELNQIQESLISHVNLDAPAAIGVLCDHCSLDADLSAEEREGRQNLRKLVLLFLANKAKKDVFGHFRGPGSDAEQVFRDGILKALGDADAQETELIVKELLLPLGSYSSRSEHGDELLRILLDKVKLTYTDIKSRPGTISLAPLQPYLSLLEHVAVVKHVADPSPLLRFYSMALIGKMALQKLDQSSQIDVIQRLADTLTVCEEERLQQPQGSPCSELGSLRNMVVDACPHILDRVVKSVSNDKRQWQASLTLLKACQQRQEDQRWTPPANFAPTLTELDTLAERAPPEMIDLTKQVQALIKELHVEPSKPTPPLKLERPGSSANKRKIDSEVPSVPGPRSGVLAKLRDDRPASMRKESRPPTPSASIQVVTEPSHRGPKLINRIGGDVSTGERSSVETPTLLRRISSSDGKASNGAAPRLTRPSSADTVSPASAPTAPMLNIKGAASKLLAKEVPPQSPALIDRMQVDNVSHDSQAGWRKKRRHKGGG